MSSDTKEHGFQLWSSGAFLVYNYLKDYTSTKQITFPLLVVYDTDLFRLWGRPPCLSHLPKLNIGSYQALLR